MEDDQQTRTLIFGTMYLENRLFVRVAELWVELVNRQDTDWVLIDSDSPLKLDVRPTQIWGFPDNIGHLSKEGGDGWGRAFCKGIELATERKYDFVVHIESDLLFRLSVPKIIREMRKQKIKIVAPACTVIDKSMLRIETGLVFMEVEYLSKIDFLGQYDWTIKQKIPRPETRITKIFNKEWRIMNLKGGRNDRGDFDWGVENFDYLTHASLNLMERFAECQR